MSNLIFKVNGININSFIKNKPTVKISSRDPLKYFSFNAAPIKLEIENDPAIIGGFSNNVLITIERNAEVIWSGYLDFPLGFSDPGKRRLVKQKVVPEVNRLKKIKFSDNSPSTVQQLLDNLVTNFSDAGFPGYSWSGNHIDNDLEIKSFYRPAYVINGSSAPNGLACFSEPFFNDQANPARLFLEDAINIGTFYHIEDGLLKNTSPIGALTPLLTGTINLPYIGDQSGVDFPNGGFGFAKIYLLLEDENNPLYFLPYVFGIWRPMLSMSVFDYNDVSSTDVILDICKLSDSLFTVNNKVISFTNNQSGNIQNTSLTLFEKRISYRNHFQFSGLNLAINTSTYVPDFAPFQSLEYYYGLKFNGLVKIYDLLFVDHSTNFKVGHILINDGVNYGRIIEVAYTAKNKEVKVKTELSEDAE